MPDLPTAASPATKLPACADTLFVSAQSTSASFRVAVDRQALRLLAVGLPGTLSFSSILSGLGVAGAASLGDILTVSSSRVIYVPGNSTGVHFFLSGSCSNWDHCLISHAADRSASSM